MVECCLAKADVEGSNPFFRPRKLEMRWHDTEWDVMQWSLISFLALFREMKRARKYIS